MSSPRIEQVREVARELAESLQSDIALCKTREEHIRVTTRANSAAALYNVLSMKDGPLEEDPAQEVA